VRATPDGHDERVRFAVLDGKTWNHPVIDRGRLLVRNLAEMAAFDLRVP
jgi:outer membrane protein assembly factor BamB